MKRKINWFTRIDLLGYMFVLPFVIGFIFLFLKPLILSVIYSFHEVSIEAGGLLMELVGFANYRKALLEDGDFIRTLIPSVAKYLGETVVIMFFSMFLAILLNQKFAGRLFFRTACFLPVVYASEVVRSKLETNGISGGFEEGGNGVLMVSQKGTEFLYDIIGNFGLGTEFTEFLSKYVNGIFNVACDSGIAIILFIIGLQSIPSHLYEVCDIEGASKWETFWKVTFPLLTPTILLCLIYTLIVRFSSENEVVVLIESNRMLQLHYACAQSVLYSVLVLILTGIVYFVVSKRVIYLD